MADSGEIQPAARAQTAGLGLGERLRSARKARALSVAQVAEALHLEEPMVVALEEERFAAMGAPVFVRGHLRRFAQLVGLAPDAVLDAYRAAVPESVAPPSLMRSRVEPETVRIGAWVFWLLGAVFVGGLVLLLAGGREKPADVPVGMMQESLPETARAPGPTPLPVQPATAEAGPAGPAAPPSAAATGDASAGGGE